MGKYNVVNSKVINEIVLYTFLFFILIFSRDTMITFMKFGFYTSYIISAIITVAILLLFLYTNKNKIKIKRLETRHVLIFIVSIIAVSLIKLDFQFYIISIISYIFIAYLCLYLYTFNDFFEKYTNIMVWLAIFSIIATYIFRPILFNNGMNNTYWPIIANSSGMKFFDFIFSYTPAISYYIRNFGLFREPGIYQVFLLFPLTYQLFISRNPKRYYKIAILAITLVTTFSLAALIILFLVFVVYFVNYITENTITKKNIIIVVSFFFIAISVVVVLYKYNNQVYDTIHQIRIKATTINDSSSARTESIKNNLNIFFNKPIIGEKFRVVQYASEHNTNTTLSMFAMFGLCAGLIHLYHLYLLSKRVANKSKISIFIFVILLLIINSQFLIGNAFYWIISLSVFMSDSNELNNSMNG